MLKVGERNTLATVKYQLNAAVTAEEKGRFLHLSDESPHECIKDHGRESNDNIV